MKIRSLKLKNRQFGDIWHNQIEDRWALVVGGDLAVWAPDRSHLVGSAMIMRQAEANLAKALGLSAREIEQLTSTNPHVVSQVPLRILPERTQPTCRT